MSSRNGILLLAGVSLLLLTCMAFFPVVAQQVPSVRVDLASDMETADISMGKGVIIRYSGNVTIQSEFPGTVHLEAYIIDEDWEVAINPNGYTPFPGDTVIEFDGTVAVPVNAMEDSYTLRVNASAEAGMPNPVNRYDTMEIVVIKNRVVVEVQEPSQLEMVQSNFTKSYIFTFKVINIGSTDDDFAFSVSDVLNVKEKGWVLGLLLEEELIAAGSFMFVNLNVTIPAHAEPGTYDFTMRADSGRTDSHAEGTVHVKVISGPPPVAKPKDDTFRFLGLDYSQLFVLTIAVIGVCMMVIFIGGTEIGLFAFLIYILVPLYCRIKKVKVLDNFTRGQIYGYIKANPGTHYMEVQNQLEITNGVLAHHLKVLEREEFIKVHRDGFYKRFYPKHVKVSKKGKHLSRLQKDLLEEVERHPGINQKMLSKYLGESKQVISYHIKVLSKAKLIRVEREGSVSKIFSKKSHKERTRLDENIDAVPEEEPVLEAEPIGDLPSMGRH